MEPAQQDSLFRLSLRAIIRNEKGEVLLVNEHDNWSLPSGGMEHGESYKEALARELYEEVSMRGSFDARLVAVAPARKLIRGVWQAVLVFEVIPERMIFTPGIDATECRFFDPTVFKDSTEGPEQLIHKFVYLKDYSL